jgi:hypothetical protein
MIRLSFDAETEQYIRLMCTRKGFTLESYILDNFEWDDKLECIDVKKITWRTCKGCDYINKCPDAKQETSKKQGADI